MAHCVCCELTRPCDGRRSAAHLPSLSQWHSTHCPKQTKTHIEPLQLTAATKSQPKRFTPKMLLTKTIYRARYKTCLAPPKWGYLIVIELCTDCTVRKKSRATGLFITHNDCIVSEDMKYNAQVVYILLLYADHIYTHIKIQINYRIALN